MIAIRPEQEALQNKDDDSQRKQRRIGEQVKRQNIDGNRGQNDQ